MSKFSQRKKFTIREIASLIATLVSTFPGVELGPLYYRSLERDKDLAHNTALGNFEANMSLSLPSIDILTWWVSSFPTACRSIAHPVPHIITTDASQLGWGAICNKVSTQGLWSTQETTYHINILEVLAVQLGLRSLLDQVQDCHIHIVSDNRELKQATFLTTQTSTEN